MVRTRFLRGTRGQNNSLTLEEGEISVDEETKAVRLHDGSTPGGYEIIGTPIEFPSPGPDTFQGGDTTAGFYGEVPASEFITGGDLATAVGLSAGTLQHDTTPWLKFSLDGQVLYVPQKPIRYDLSWEAIYQAGVVYGVDGYGSNPSGGQVDQGTIVTIGGQDYRVRLLRGTDADPGGADAIDWDPAHTHTSEWNRLMYPVHSGVHTDDRNPSDPSVAYAQWASYSDADLLVEYTHGNGSRSWCQETVVGTNYRVGRGYHGVSIFFRNAATFTSTRSGWRPCLVPIT